METTKLIYTHIDFKKKNTYVPRFKRSIFYNLVLILRFVFWSFTDPRLSGILLNNFLTSRVYSITRHSENLLRIYYTPVHFFIVFSSYFQQGLK